MTQDDPIRTVHWVYGKDINEFACETKGVSETDSDRMEIGPGSVAFVPAGVPHATTNLSDSESLKAIIIKSPPGDEEVRL